MSDPRNQEEFTREAARWLKQGLRFHEPEHLRCRPYHPAVTTGRPST